MWCIDKGIWLTPAHIPGVDNVEADLASRVFNDKTEWQYIYIFPPFSIIPRILQKIEEDQAQALMIVPLWATQPWFPKITRMLIQQPVLLPKNPRVVTLPFQRETAHPLQRKLQLMACRLSGQDSQGVAFRQGLRRSCSSHGARGPKNNTKSTYKNGYFFCSGRHTDPVQPTVAAVIDFLTELLDSGLGYSGLNTARCALSTFTILEENTSIGSHPLVKRLLKAAYQIQPSFPRYQFMWDTSIVLNYLRDLPSLQDIKLKTLTLKLVMLCALVTGQRCQSIHLMNLEQMFIGPEFCKFVINDIVK